MDLQAKLLIVLLHGLMVKANNFSFTGGNIINLTDPNGVDQDIVQSYGEFVNQVIFKSDSVLNATLAKFSNAFKDCYWCYPPYGCLQIGGPFISPYHPFSLPPLPPWLMNVKIELYTRKNPTTPFVFDPNDISQIYMSNFNNNSDTKFTIDGWNTGNGFESKQTVIPALLDRSDYNVFHVNWLMGSLGPYQLAEANGRLVGAMVAYFIGLLKNTTGHPFTKIHLIGVSIGAHICGYAGKYHSGQLARISGLDPAGPDYEQTDPLVRLSSNDASFVDVMHTFAGPLTEGKVGIDQKIGDIDFYPNGGSEQPKPSLSDLLHLSNLADVPKVSIALSSHSIALLYYAESIMNSTCKFISYACSDFATFQLGLLGPCHTCGSNGSKCAEMGFNSIKYAAAGHPLPAPDKFYLTTNGFTPYCKN